MSSVHNSEGWSVRRRSLVLLALVVAWTQGCLAAPPLITGAPLSEEAVKRIEPGRTTKAQLFEWFGAPMAIGETGEQLRIPRETVWTVEGPVRQGGYHEVDADTFFELFGSKHNIGDHHRIYYYYRAVSTKYAVVAVLAIYETGRTRVHKLWVLVNEDIGTVEDYVFRPED